MDAEFFKKYPALAQMQQLQIEQYELDLRIPNGNESSHSYLKLIEIYQRL